MELVKPDHIQALAELNAAKPPPRETPLPDLLIYKEKSGGPRGTPEIVTERLRDMREERERIAQMWNAEGKTKFYVPNTSEARKMKMQAKLHNRAEAKHAEIVKRRVQLETKAIEMPKDVVVVHAIEL